jgi:hypothetical protein
MFVRQNCLHIRTWLLAASAGLALTACESTGTQSRLKPQAALPPTAVVSLAAVVQPEAVVPDPVLLPDTLPAGADTPSMDRSLPPAAAPANDPRGPIVQLDAYSVMGEPPKLSFGLALQIWQSGHEAKVGALYITRVRDHSDAAMQGLVPGTRIDKVDGRDVLGFAANFKSGGELNAAFINRKIGSQVELEVLLPHTTATIKVILVERLNQAPHHDMLPRI